MPSNVKEEGFETHIVKHLTEINGYEEGKNSDYNRDYAVDETRLFRFLKATQPEKLEKLGLEIEANKIKFLNRLQGEIAKSGVIEVLRNGFKIYPVTLDMYYMMPSVHNPAAKVVYEKNIFSVTRQLTYSKDSTRLALDFVVFLNGLPLMTFELKNRFTKQNIDDAILQYKSDRNPKELLFNFGRCMVHFAMDDNQVAMCTKLDGKKSWFLPFNKGYKGGAGNPPNPSGIRTDYLWKEILTKLELSNIIENFAQIIGEKDEETKKIKRTQIFPRYHQLSAVKALLADVAGNGVGHKYLIQHSAGSGKSNSIAWLAHQLISMQRFGKPVFDSIIVVTDRINLDKQIKNTIKGFMQVVNTVGHAESSGDLKKLLEDGKKIIVTIVHKFPYILDDIGTIHRRNNFAIIIDEAHSSQSGSMSAKMNMALSSDYGQGEEESTEDKINSIIEGRKMLKNASYFAFTATPKNKTLEMFGVPYEAEGKTMHKPFHNYTMKQAIQEGFILDVLKYYMPINSYYKIAKTVEDDPSFDKKKAQKKLRKYVESQEKTIELKAEIMMDHFLDHVIAKGKIGGQARAMVVTSGIERAIQYYYAINNYLQKRRSAYKAIAAFSGEYDYGRKKVTESSVNGFAGSEIEKRMKRDPYRVLVVADKFQTGYDEPLLHTMYVDKVLTDIKAVQTLSRLNRAHSQKHDTFILDFANETDTIKESFEKYYTTTVLSDVTDPNKLNDLESGIRAYHVFTDYHVNSVVELYLNGADRDRLDPILDACAHTYEKDLDENGQVDFKSKCKGFVRTYGFLAAILHYGNPDWEKLSIFLNLLIHKLPSPIEEDLSAGILEAIDLDSYRLEAQTALSIVLEEQGEYSIDPVPTSAGGGKGEAELDLLSNILSEFNDLFGNIEWKDIDQVKKRISEIPEMVAKDKDYQNAMKNSDKQNAKIESDKALNKAIMNIMSDNMEVFKQFSDNSSFKKWLSDMVFNLTFNTDDSVYQGQARI